MQKRKDEQTMAAVKPFRCIRPDNRMASQVAALPYDVYNRNEACQAIAGKPYSFLNIDRADTHFPEAVGMYEPCVYERARELLEQMIAEGIFVSDEEECYYIYRLTMDGRDQTGIVACSSIDDYRDGVIKKHEETRGEKELDRIRHVDVTDTQTGPIFLAYRGNGVLAELVEAAVKTEPLYDFVSEDGIGHKVWRIREASVVNAVEDGFKDIPSTYIADGHHRAASAVKVGLKRREEHPGYTGEEPFNYFLSVLFQDDQLMIMPYNRVVRDLNGLEEEEFLEKVRVYFDVACVGAQAVTPAVKGTFGMYLDDEWYLLTAKPEILSDDPVHGLDVSILQDYLLSGILGIKDPGNDSRIKFIGGIRGAKGVEQRVDLDMKIGFSMFPTSIGELFRAADAGCLMPAKSTWFEPKLRSGLFLHRLT